MALLEGLPFLVEPLPELLKLRSYVMVASDI
jgi:hypothetical protein